MQRMASARCVPREVHGPLLGPATDPVPREVCELGRRSGLVAVPKYWSLFSTSGHSGVNGGRL
jgi:hypothetical protein